MRILIVCSGNVENFNLRIHQPFIVEQIEVISKTFKVDYDFYFIVGKGFLGYLSNLYPLIKKIKQSNSDIIHAHFGLSGFLSVLQRCVPVVVTFHGSDFNNKKTRIFSLVSRKLAAASIFVSKRMMGSLYNNKTDFIIPCGIDLDMFIPVDKMTSRSILGLTPTKKYILFASSFNNKVKNFPLAKEAVELVNSEIEIIELKNKDRIEVKYLLCAVDLLLLTSTSEGSPQIIKEAMACNCPIVTTDVGDVKEVISDSKFCFIVDFSAESIKEKILLILEQGQRSNGSDIIKRFDNSTISKEVYEIYKKVLNNDL
jgi:teichuronic acid biosynthesis glycosyltransferase TuaC